VLFVCFCTASHGVIKNDDKGSQHGGIVYPLTLLTALHSNLSVKLAFHDADIDILVDILVRFVARISACRSACHGNNSRVLDMSAMILARMSVSVSVSASWN